MGPEWREQIRYGKLSKYSTNQSVNSLLSRNQITFKVFLPVSVARVKTTESVHLTMLPIVEHAHAQPASLAIVVSHSVQTGGSLVPQLMVLTTSFFFS